MLNLFEDRIEDEFFCWLRPILAIPLVHKAIFKNLVQTDGAGVTNVVVGLLEK